MLCIYRSKANFAENMANNVKKRVKVPASTPKRKQRMVCLMSEEEVRIVDCYLKKYKITNKARAVAMISPSASPVLLASPSLSVAV